MSIRGAWDMISATIVAFVAIVMLALYLHDRQALSSAQGLARTVSQVDGRDWQASGIQVGPTDAPVVVRVFADFSCPHCAALVPVLDSLIREFPDRVTLQHYHFPLSQHEFAIAGAIAAECAEQQGKFPEMYHALFFQADSLGSKSWTALAEEAGVPDLGLFEQCVKRPAETFPRIGDGQELGRRIGVRGTPSVWIDGELFQGRTLSAFRERLVEMGLMAVSIW